MSDVAIILEIYNSLSSPPKITTFKLTDRAIGGLALWREAACLSVGRGKPRGGAGSLVLFFASLSETLKYKYRKAEASHNRF